MRVSEDPGVFLCAYIFYASLAELRRRGEPGAVELLHIPPHHNGAWIAKGVEVATNLIIALAKQVHSTKTL